jgi:hypothetical protein
MAVYLELDWALVVVARKAVKIAVWRVVSMAEMKVVWKAV